MIGKYLFPSFLLFLLHNQYNFFDLTYEKNQYTFLKFETTQGFNNDMGSFFLGYHIK